MTLQVHPIQEFESAIDKEDWTEWKKGFWPVYLNIYGTKWSTHSVCMTKGGVRKELQKLSLKYPSRQFIIFGDSWDNGFAIYANPPIVERVKEILLGRGQSVTLPVYRGKVIE